MGNWHRAVGWMLGAGCCVLLGSCGGGGGASDGASEAALTEGRAAVGSAPLAVIGSPASGTVFQAGDTLTFAGSASDAEDGALPAASLGWWADLHHDTHTHPFRLPSSGASGSVTIPVRGETSPHIFYRFHLKATDSAGNVSEALRDIYPKLARVMLATEPAGLQLTLDGQPVSTPYAFAGVVGMERDLGAAGQVMNGRRYGFSTWNDGGSATHTISTPAAETRYVATFADLGPATNLPPTVSVSAPAGGTVGTPLALSANAADSDGTIAKLEFLDGGTLLGTDTTSPYAFSWSPTSAGAHSITARATDNGGAVTTSAALTVSIAPAGGADTQPPMLTLSQPADVAADLTGRIDVVAQASDNTAVAGVEFQLDGLLWGAEDTQAPYQTSITTGNHASGQHVIRARARDTSGNRSDWVTRVVQFGNDVQVSQGFVKNDAWVGGLEDATSFAQAPDGRLFVAEQDGRLRIVKNGALLPTPFATLTVDSAGERGLIGVALHPDFARNGWVYVYHTTLEGGTHNRISRFVANGDVAAGPPTALFGLPALSSATNHNGGAMHFGKDGKLYVGVGDNARGAPAQDKASLFGKLLRLNDDGSIPADNPFYATSTGNARAVWAYGLRNPFTFAVRASDGRILINDVGEVTWEEIDVGTAGANYGWPGSEGPANVTAGITAPMFTYRHTATTPPGTGPGGFFVGQCIAGGVFYPAGGSFPARYRGNYFFGDFVTHRIGWVDLANGNAAYAFAQTAGEPVDLLVANDGALLVLTRVNIARIAPG